MALAIFGITDDGLSLFVNLLILFLVVVWLALIAWTYLDARRRVEDPVLVASATAASLFPYVGTVVYLILRPPEFLEDARERELETRAAELRVRQLEEQSCPNCEYPIERTYLRCPNCRTRVKDPCDSCGKPVDPRWSICPHCETPLPQAAPPPRRATAPSRAAPPARTARAASSARVTAPSGKSPAAARSASRKARATGAGGTASDGTAPERSSAAKKRKPAPSRGRRSRPTPAP
jgi:Double zinc ribbon